MPTSRAAGVPQRSEGADDRAGVPGGSGAADAAEPVAITSHRAKGGISVMAKKTAKGGKKKGGKKR
jgi:hypothetical protein